jgi:hypothetical protein
MTTSLQKGKLVQHETSRNNIIIQVHAISYMAIAILEKTTIIWD